MNRSLDALAGRPGRTRSRLAFCTLLRRLAGAAVAATLAAAPAVASPSPAELFADGLAAAEAGDYASALDKLEAALAAEPNNLRYGAEYRQAAIAAEAYDRSIDFFEALVEAHPDAANAFLNFGYAYVDKIPAAGAITQVILANTALGHFSTALELEETWLGRYTRGNSYLYWPAIFGRTSKGIADLERAIEMAEDLKSRPYHARAWVSLGDGYWRLDKVDRSREVWRQGLKRYPGNEELEARLALGDEELDAFLEAHFATDRRVETHLREIWGGDE